MMMGDDGVSVSSSVTHRGLRLHVKKQLAKDIESNGGIKAFASSGKANLLYNLLQERVGDADNLYGERGDPIRNKIGKLVNYWYKLDRQGKYTSEILNPWQIVQWEALDHNRTPSRQTPAQTPPRTPRKTPVKTPQRPSSSKQSRIEEESASDSNSDSISDSDGFTATSNRNPRTSRFKRAAEPRQTPPRPVVLTEQQQPSTPLSPPFVQPQLASPVTHSFLKYFANMSVDPSQKKRKLAGVEIDQLIPLARKFHLDGLISGYPVVWLTYFPFPRNHCCRLQEKVSIRWILYLLGHRT